ncbi:hypothetical protein L596_028843 [Steinernema carpocapsae]|uniref:Uncharacterized protein n=1 Tax=Steinernema carpocapsae TaxID=34508 RepID=A0A4U5LZI7_STECR|nr:hypothetical protein L596_028843 [Steinernema carpocapsae]
MSPEIGAKHKAQCKLQVFDARDRFKDHKLRYQTIEIIAPKPHLKCFYLLNLCISACYGIIEEWLDSDYYSFEMVTAKRCNNNTTSSLSSDVKRSTM